MKNANVDPSFRSIEEHIRRAHLERSVYIAAAISSGITTLGRVVSGAVAALAGGWKGRLRGPRVTAKRSLAPR